jgi:hypothetical protein
MSNGAKRHSSFKLTHYRTPELNPKNLGTLGT